MIFQSMFVVFVIGLLILSCHALSSIIGRPFVV